MTESDRRPIAARNTGWAQALAAWLVRRRASANGISVAGMVAALGGGACLALTVSYPQAARPLWLLAAVLVQLRLLANLLDGMVAIGRGVASATGELFNEIPDRVSDTAVLAGLGVAAGHPALGLGAALAAMGTAYVRAVGRGLGQPSDFSGPMAKQHRMAWVTGICVASALLPHRLTAPWVYFVLIYILGMSVFTALRRLIRLAGALRA